MEVNLEISYYPVKDYYLKPIDEFIASLNENPDVKVETGLMSTMLSGSYEDVMSLLINSIKPLMEKFPSVFVIKMTNACDVCSSEN